MTKHKGGVVLWIVFMAVALIFTSGAIAVYTVFMKPEKMSQVPALTGKSLVEAAAESEKLGLVVQVEPVASTMPDGKVLAQSPEAGTELRKGQVIVLQVSRSGELHEVPDVKGQTLADAQAMIRDNGFTLGDVVKIRESGVEAGIVIAQSPASPASVSSGRKIDILVQDGAASDGSVVIPDVNRMTESEARNVIETSGLKVNGVDRVYSPLLPEGLAIETRPAAGTKLSSGQGVILKLATQRRPAGFMDGKTTANVRRVNTNEDRPRTETTTTTPPANTRPQTQPSKRNVTVPVNGGEDVFIGDDYTTTPAPTNNKNSSRTAATTTRTSSTPSQPRTQTTSSTPSQPRTQTTTSTPSTPPAPTTQTTSGGSKTARIRYVVPPIGQPMNLKIEVTDTSGKREIMNRQVKGGDSVSATASYSNECMVSIYLGGQPVWQEKYR